VLLSPKKIVHEKERKPPKTKTKSTHVQLDTTIISSSSSSPAIWDSLPYPLGDEKGMWNDGAWRFFREGHHG